MSVSEKNTSCREEKDKLCDQGLSSDCEESLKLARDFKGSLNPELRTKCSKDWRKKMSHEDARDIRSKYGNLKVFQGPLCFIRNDKTGRLSICKDVMEEISTIEDTINIITIAGPYRTGKSYLMNRLAGVKKGFPLGNTTDATTKGLWVWCLEHPERKDEVLMLIDTEGIGDVKKGDEGNDNAILCLATLLSGTFVYNCFGVIDHNLLKTLSFVTKLSEMIITSNASPQSDLDVGFFFPTFVLCLRDFTQNISENGTPDTYFEDCLAPDMNGDKGNREKFNEIRISILEHFQRRKCFVFDRPAGREILKKLEEVSESDLSKDFLDDSEKFLRYMYICEPKELIDGSSINGRMFATLTEMYIVSLANGEMSCIDDALTVMAIQENEIAVKEAVGMCKMKIKSLGIPLPKDFELKYRQIQRDALQTFRKKAVLDDKQVFQKIAEKEMDSFKKEIMEESKTILQKTCLKELQSMYDILIKPKVDKGTYFEQGGYKTYREDFAGLVKNIKKRTDGVDSYIVHMSGLEFENRYREQDKEILEKANFSENEIKAEMKKQRKTIKKKTDELVQKEDLKNQSETKSWEDYKEELSAERKQEQKELEEKYVKALEVWEKGKKDLESKIREKDEIISNLRKSNSRSQAVVSKKPALKETVLKTLLSLFPVAGPIASGFYERFSSP